MSEVTELSTNAEVAAAEVLATDPTPVTERVEVTLNANAAVAALQKEESLRFGEGVKVRFEQRFAADKITAPDTFNVRLVAGQESNGVTVKKDRRNIMGMVDGIKSLNGITTPLVVSEREDGSFVLLQGYRRYNGAKFIRDSEPASALADKLKYLPVQVYTGLTREQERYLINDQTQKSYTPAEVLLMFWEQLQGGYSWDNIALRMYQQIGHVTGSNQRVEEIDAIEDPHQKRKELMEWLSGTCQQFWANAYLRGPITKRDTLQSYLFRSGQTDNRPEVLMDANRMKALNGEAVKDIKAGEWSHLEGRGPRFDKKYNEFKELDAKKVAAGGKRVASTEPKLRSPDDFKKTLEFQGVANGPDSLVCRLLKIAYKDGGAPEATRLVHGYDKLRAVYLTHRPMLNTRTTSVLDVIFDPKEGGEDVFSDFLIDNYEDESIGQAAREQPPEIAPVPAHEMVLDQTHNPPTVVEEQVSPVEVDAAEAALAVLESEDQTSVEVTPLVSETPPAHSEPERHPHTGKAKKSRK